MELDPARAAEVSSEVDRLARRGLRVLAVAERPAADGEPLGDGQVDGLVLAGFVGVADTARPSAAARLRQLSRAGIDCVMVTGDHPSTAEAVATHLGLLNGRRVITGPDLDALDDDGLDHRRRRLGGLHRYGRRRRRPPGLRPGSRPRLMPRRVVAAGGPMWHPSGQRQISSLRR